MTVLVERLRAVDHMDVEDCFVQSPLYAEAADRIEALEAALRDIAKDLQSSSDVHEFNARHMIAEDSLQDAWAMLDLAKQQFHTDANSLQIPLSRARTALSEPNHE